MSQAPAFQHIQAALADPDLARESEAAPLLLLSGPPTRLAWANALAASYFKMPFEDLAERLQHGDEPGAKRLRQMPYVLRADAGARQESLRFRLSGDYELSTWRAWRLRSVPNLVAAILTQPALKQEAKRVDPSPQGEAPGQTALAQPDSSVLAGLRARWAQINLDGRSLRFRWRADADEKISEIEGPLCAVVGGDEADLIGQDLAIFAQAHGADPGDRIARARAARETWSRSRVDWPVAGAPAFVPITLGAAPTFARGNRFDGWIGYGVIDIEGAHRAPAAAAPLSEDTPPARDNVVALRRTPPPAEAPPVEPPDAESRPQLSPDEAEAFEKIALALKLAAPQERPARPPEDVSAPIAEKTFPTIEEPAQNFEVRPKEGDAETGRVRALEAELRRRAGEARELHAILDTATDGVVVLDKAGQLISLNRAGEALFGRDQSDAVGKPFTALLAPESHDAALDYFNLVASNGVASLLNDGREVSGLAHRGGAFPIFMTLGRLPSNGDARFCAVLRDMTAWKKVEAELNEARREAEKASALKSDFLAKISHEIRTPLNAILGFAEVIMDERFGPIGNERYREYLKDIHASGAHVMSLVNDLLDLSKIEAGKMELAFAAVDVNQIVGECVSIMQPQANSERVIVRLSTAPRLPQVMADERSLRQIVLNLLSNAVKFNEPGGQVIVSTALTDAGHVVIRVRDTGVGMSDSELVTALEPFRQVQTSRQTSGTGLGLPLTKALVEANHGSLTVKSRKAEGTLVEVALPLARVMAD